jgi:hypothetical protein
MICAGWALFVAAVGAIIVVANIDDTTIVILIIVIISPPPMPRLPPLSSPLQVDFEKCKNGNIGNDCHMSINGMDFRIPQTGNATTGNWFASHKYAGKSTLRY